MESRSGGVMESPDGGRVMETPGWGGDGEPRWGEGDGGRVMETPGWGGDGEPFRKSA